jgi:NhaP-type Na+/H+ or K+/H+ antiporter
MFWALLAFLFLAFVFLKLGAMSVWVTILAGALQAVLLGAAALIAFLGWRYWRSR